MKIEIKDVTRKEVEVIRVGDDEIMRFVEDGVWYHLIDRNGGTWLRYPEPELYEDALVIWKRKERKNASISGN